MPVTGGIEPSEFSVEAMLSDEMGSSAGKILVFALRDTTQPWLICGGSSVDDGCTMLVSGDEAVGGFVSLRGLGRKIQLFLEDTFELAETISTNDDFTIERWVQKA